MCANLKWKSIFRLKRLRRIFYLAVILVITFVILANRIVEKTTNNLTYNDLNQIPHNKTGLLLGTSKFVRSGKPNQYFQNRIKAAVELYNAHKIDYIVISGDNSTHYYNEPIDMKNALLKLGIPNNAIILDYAGFRTFDSVIRLNKIFGQEEFTVISQEFQNRRAIYIARHYNLRAIGYNAKDVNVYNGFRTRVREKFARVKVFIDILFNKQPKFLGEKIEIK